MIDYDKPIVQKRALAVHDISGVGKCSLTVALPIISAASVECSVLPTAVLSTHTGGFTGYTVRDLTEDIIPMVRHWQSLKVRFDAIYTGYLGSFSQVQLMKKMAADLSGENTIVLVDPVMGDNGRLYAAFNEAFPPEMLELCRVANIIKPNITEALFLLGEKYQEGPYSREYLDELLQRLAALTEKPSIVLTGAWLKDDPSKLGAATYDRSTGKIDYILGPAVEGSYHGTGDVFGSALVGAALTDHSLAEAVRIAVDFTVRAIRLTRAAGTDIRYGVNFEACLGSYIKDLGLC